VGGAGKQCPGADNWVPTFNDTQLDELVKTIAYNADLRIAAARVASPLRISPPSSRPHGRR
jgi:hypothetical protein